MEAPDPQRQPTADRISYPDEPRARANPLSIEQLGWATACLLLVLASLESGPDALTVSYGDWASVTFLLGGLAGMFYCLRTRRPSSRLQLFVLVGLGFALFAKAAGTFFANPSYGTDAVAFDQYAAQLVLHGHNPYTTSMAPALEMFRVPSNVWTLFLSGGYQHLLSYPAGSFIPYIPPLALGVSTQAGPIVDLLAWFVGTVLLWVLLPRAYKWIAAVILAASLYVSYIVGGVTDALYLPPLLLALWRWDRFADRSEHSVARWIGPVMLGLAVTVKQTPWVLLPFLSAGVALEASARGDRGWKTGLRYLGIAGGVFALVNSPFIAVSPGAWARDVLAPLTSPAIPDGQGLVSLAVSSHVGGGRLAMFSIAALALLALGFAAFVVTYPRAKQGWPAAIAVVFFFPTRSLGNYIAMMAPAVLLAAVSVRPSLRRAGSPRRKRWQRIGLATGVVAVLALLGIAVGSRSPLDLRITGLRTTGQFSTIAQISVTAHNRTNHALTPRFSVNSNHASTFWYVLGGRAAGQLTVPPHQTRSVVLQAPDAQSMPAVSQDFSVEAFTRHPDAVSTSDRLRFSQALVYLTPTSVDRRIPVGQPMRFVAQIHTRFGTPIRRAGTIVELGQVVYTPPRPVTAASSINAGAPGKSAVARTDASGQAGFTVIGLRAQDAPVFYQAWIDNAQRGPSGYSTPVLVHYYQP